MKPVKFKRKIFGFSTRQVLGYIDETERENTAAYAKLEAESGATILNLQTENKNIRATTESQLEIMKNQLEEQKRVADEAIQTAKTDRANYEIAVERSNELFTQVTRFKDALTAGVSEIDRLNMRVTELESTAAAYLEEINSLNEQQNIAVSSRERYEDESMRQKAVLTDYMETLHKKNIELSEKISSLETALALSEKERTILKIGSVDARKKETGKSQVEMLEDIRKEISLALGLVADDETPQQLRKFR